MFKVLGKLFVNNLYCVSVEGDTLSLKIGLKLTDEKGHIFIIKSIGMPHYTNPENYKTHAELVLDGDVEDIGTTLLAIE